MRDAANLAGCCRAKVAEACTRQPCPCNYDPDYLERNPQWTAPAAQASRSTRVDDFDPAAWDAARALSNYYDGPERTDEDAEGWLAGALVAINAYLEAKETSA